MRQTSDRSIPRPACPNCGEVLVRCVVEWEDGSASVLWRCGCQPIPAELGVPAASLAGAMIRCGEPEPDSPPPFKGQIGQG